MKISTDNGHMRNRFGDVKAIEMIARAGFDGIDYTFYDIDPRCDILALPEQQRRSLASQVRRCASDHAIVFPQAHAPYGCRPGETKGAKSYQEVLHSMEFAAEIGCKQIVIHTLKFPKEKPQMEVDAFNREFLRSFLPYADELDLEIGVENLFIRDAGCGCVRGQHASAQEMNAFVDSLCSKRFKVCCDLGHAAICKVEPHAFIKGMDAGRMTMIHAHDTDYKNDLHTLPWLGEQNWEAITDALAEIGFEGTMNMELCGYYPRFPDELVPEALRMAAQTARWLAAKVDMKRGRQL